MVPTLQTVFPGYFSPNAPQDMYAAMGMNGQFIDIVPSENMVWIRMGEAPTTTLVPYLMHNEIWDYLNDLNCNQAGIETVAPDTISIYPNPVTEQLNIQSSQVISYATVENMSGQIIKKVRLNEGNQIQMNDLDNGIYLISLQLNDGVNKTYKIIKN